MDDTFEANVEVTILREDQSTLCIQLSFFDSVQEIKEMIEKNTKISVHNQTLIFNGQVLQNEDAVLDIRQDIPIKLIVASDSFTHQLHHKLEPTPPIQDIHELMQLPVSQTSAPTVDQMLFSETLVAAALSSEDFPAINSNEFETDIGEMINMFLDTTAPTLDPILASQQTSPPAAQVHTPSSPQSINEYLEDSEEVLELINMVQTPNKEDFEELMQDKPTPPETTSPAPVLPSGLDFNEAEVSPLRPPSPRQTRVEFTVEVLGTRIKPFKVEMDLDDTVLQLKENIHRQKRRQLGRPSEFSVRLKPGQELNDQWTLRDCGMLTSSTVSVLRSLKLPLAPSLSHHPNSPLPPHGISPAAGGAGTSNSRLHPQRISTTGNSRLHPQPVSPVAAADSNSRLHPQRISATGNSRLHPQPVSSVAAGDNSNSRLHSQPVSRVAAADNSNLHLHPQQISTLVASNSNSRLHPQQISRVVAAANSNSRLHPQPVSQVAAGNSKSRLHPQPQRISQVVGTDNSNSRLHPQRISIVVAAADSNSCLHPQQNPPVVAADNSNLHPQISPMGTVDSSTQNIVPAADDLNSHLQPQQISPVGTADSSGSQPQQISPVTAADPILGTKMLNVFVFPKGGTQKIPMKINVYNKVATLRDELERSHKDVIPEKGRYFFTYQNKGFVMTDSYVFNWYQMEDGDTIEITPESGPAEPNRKKWTIPSSSTQS